MSTTLVASKPEAVNATTTLTMYLLQQRSAASCHAAQAEDKMRIRMITVRTWYLAESQHVDRKAKHRIKFQQIALPPMESMLAGTTARWHAPFRTQTRLQQCRPACNIRCEAVHRRHVALQLASRDLNLYNSLVDSSVATAADTQDATALNRRSLALAAVTLGLLTPLRGLAGECSSLAR